MSLRYGRKISDLSELTASTAQTYILGIDGDTSYKIAANVIGGEQLPTGVLSSSAQITAFGFISSSQSINTGSLLQTSSFNQYTASVKDKITSNYVTASVTDNFDNSFKVEYNADSLFIINQSGSVAINTSSFEQYYPETLLIVSHDDTTYNLIVGKSNTNNYSQFNLKNQNTGSLASSDIVATTDDGDENQGYIDMGINSSTYYNPYFVGRERDAYLYSMANHLHIGNASANQPLTIFAGGPDTEINQKLLINPNNNHELTGSLSSTEGFYGTIYADNGVISGSKQITDLGFISSSQTINTASFATTGSNTFTADQTIDGVVYFRDTAVEGGETANIVHNDGDFKITAADNGDIILATYGDTTHEWIFDINGDLTVSNNVNGADNLATTGSNSFNGNQTISGSLTLSGSMNIVTTSALQIGTGSGDEGGEILLAKAITNTSLTGSGITIDSYRDRLRIFEQGGNARGAFLNIASQSAGVASEIVTSTSVNNIQTITSASYAAITPVSGTLYIIIG